VTPRYSDAFVAAPSSNYGPGSGRSNSGRERQVCGSPFSGPSDRGWACRPSWSAVAPTPEQSFGDRQLPGKEAVRLMRWLNISSTLQSGACHSN
jgi:hypothetical protein